MRHSILIAVSALALAACATATDDAPEEVVEVVAEETSAEAVLAEEFKTPATVTTPALTGFELAMQTVEGLVAAGNDQTAIDRIEQMLGNPSYTKTELAQALFRRGEIRMSDTGFDVMGAIGDFDEVIETYGDTEWATAAATARDTARGKATSLNFLMAQPTTSRLDQFKAMMQLGDHDAAKDFMAQYNLTPCNTELLALYQIGWLCEGDTLTGQAYNITEPDGTARTVRFCDLGK